MFVQVSAPVRNRAMPLARFVLFCKRGALPTELSALTWKNPTLPLDRDYNRDYSKGMTTNPHPTNPTQTMATRCTHGRQAILDMDGIRRHVGGAWEPCEGQPPALVLADDLEAAGFGPLPTWPPARANAALRLAEADAAMASES